MGLSPRIGFLLVVAVGSALIGLLSAYILWGQPGGTPLAEQPSIITSPVRQETVEGTVRARATLAYSSTIDIQVTEGLTVTRPMPPVGDELGSGDLIAELSNRPLILIVGSIPLFRDLYMGDEGADVESLRDSLADLELVARGEGPVDRALLDAVTKLYVALGYRPPDAVAEDLAALMAAQSALTAAEDGQAEATRALDDQKGSPDALARLAAEVARDDARALHQQVLVGPEAELTELRVAREAAIDYQVQAKAQLDGLMAALAAAKQDATTTDTGLHELQTQIDSATTILADADTAALAAEADVLAAESALDLLRASEDRRLRLAEAAYLAAVEPADTRAAMRAVAEAEAALEAAKGQLEREAMRSYSRVAAHEFVVVDTGPTRVSRIDSGLGDTTRPNLGAVSLPSVIAGGTINPNEASNLSVSNEVRVLLPDGEVGDAELVDLVPPDAGSDTDRWSFTARLEPGVALEHVGRNFAIEIVFAESSAGAIVVPLAAIRSLPDGRQGVEIVRPDGSREQVSVNLGVVSDGAVEITASDPAISLGDSVVVGLTP